MHFQNGMGGAFDQNRNFFNNFIGCGIQIADQILLLHIDDAADKKVEPNFKILPATDFLGNFRKIQRLFYKDNFDFFQLAHRQHCLSDDGVMFSVFVGNFNQFLQMKLLITLCAYGTLPLALGPRP